jgi:hypothetical protein
MIIFMHVYIVYVCVCVHFFLLIGYYDPRYDPRVTIFQLDSDSHTQDKHDPDL